MNPRKPHQHSETNRSFPRRLWQWLWANIVDEAVGLLLLRAIFRYRRHSPQENERFYEPFEGLFSGDLETFFSPEPSEVDLWKHRQQRKTHHGQTVWDFHFPSPVQTTAEENAQVRARLWTGGTEPARRCLVGVDGVVQFDTSWFAKLADELTPAGVDVVMMDAPFNFRRTPPGYRPGQLILSGDLEHQLAVTRQAVLDLWTLVKNLQHEGREVGLIGVSFGGWMSLMTGVLASDLALITAVAPPVDLETLLEEGGTIVREVRRGLGHGPLPEETIRQAVKAVTPSCWTPRLDPARISLHAAEFDRFVPTPRIRKLAERWGTRFTVHPTGHMGLTQKSRYIHVAAEEILNIWD